MDKTTLAQIIKGLRNVSPKVNAAADEATRVARDFEKFLTEECQIGITAQVSFEWEDEEKVVLTLSYERFDGVYKIIVKDPRKSEIQRLVDCPRRLRLVAVGKLPELLLAIYEEAQKLNNVVDLTMIIIGKVTNALAQGK